jgi:excisionase family DNA binding protein
MKNFLMTHDVAKLLGVSSEMVRLYERQGRLPAQRTVGGARLFSSDDVRAFAALRSASGVRRGDTTARSKSEAGQRRHDAPSAM